MHPHPARPPPSQQETPDTGNPHTTVVSSPFVPGTTLTNHTEIQKRESPEVSEAVIQRIAKRPHATPDPSRDRIQLLTGFPNLS